MVTKMKTKRNLPCISGYDGKMIHLVPTGQPDSPYGKALCGFRSPGYKGWNYASWKLGFPECQRCKGREATLEAMMAAQPKGMGFA